jgi:hypothetical protein
MSRLGTIAIQAIVVGQPCRKGNRVREQLLYWILLLGQPCRKGNRGREQFVYRILLFGQVCRKGNRVREQLQNEPDIAGGTAM